MPDSTGRDVPAVLFLCVHNAGRSQMALGWFRELAGDRAQAFSGGSEPAETVNPVAVAAMAEVGIDITGEAPRRWTDEMAREADVIVTMGCGDTCPVYPGTRRVDWELTDPAGRPLDEVRPVRDEIGERVRRLLDELLGNDAEVRELFHGDDDSGWENDRDAVDQSLRDPWTLPTARVTDHLEAGGSVGGSGRGRECP
jgi:protein-tyrosine-phosphatase